MVKSPSTSLISLIYFAKPLIGKSALESRRKSAMALSNNDRDEDEGPIGEDEQSQEEEEAESER
jgi:hypothetical protein